MEKKELNTQTLVDTSWAVDCLQATGRGRRAAQKAARPGRRWKVLAAVMILTAVGGAVSYQAGQPRPEVRAGVKIPLAASLPQQQPTERPLPLAPRQSEDDRRREAAAAARAQTRYAAEIRRLKRDQGQRALAGMQARPARR